MEDTTSTCSCGCGSKPTISEREKCLISLAYHFAMKDAGAIKQSIISAKSAGITTEEVKEVCSEIADYSKESVLSLIGIKTPVIANRCCV